MFPEWKSILDRNIDYDMTDKPDEHITASEAVNRIWQSEVCKLDNTKADFEWKIITLYYYEKLSHADRKSILTNKFKLHIIVEGHQDLAFENAYDEWKWHIDKAKKDRAIVNLLEQMEVTEPKEAEPVKDIEHDMFRVNRVTYHDGHCEYKVMKGRAKNGIPVEDTFNMAKGTRQYKELSEAIEECNKRMANVVIDEGKAYTPLLATAKKEHAEDEDWGDY